MQNEVIQSDREAAADVWRDYVARVGEVMAEKAIRSGSADRGLVQAFTAHRIATTAAERERAERAEAALRELRDTCFAVSGKTADEIEQWVRSTACAALAASKEGEQA